MPTHEDAGTNHDPDAVHHEVVGRAMAPMPSPTKRMLEGDPLYDTIWGAIHSWDVNVPEYYTGYCGATGSHATLIYNAIVARFPDGNQPPLFIVGPDMEAELVGELSRPGSIVRVASSMDTYQRRIHAWMLACFGEEVAADRTERNHRFLEEALELVQANGCTQSEAHQLVDYVYGRPAGEVNQEAGGVMVTLAALLNAIEADMVLAAETELARVWTKVEQIRAKQAAKPKHSPLPE